MTAKKQRCERCRKVKFPTRNKATMAALTLATTVGMGWRAYRCPIGKSWHLTTKPDTS